jgi:hypothetical protein
MKTTLFFAAFLVIAAVVLCGCSNVPPGFVKDSRPGTTSFEANAQMQRGFEVDRQGLMSDIDHFWFFDKPTRLNELRIR